MEYFKIGKFVAVHGLKGELILKHALGKKTSLKDLKNIFIEEHKKTFLPWFPQSSKIKNDTEVYIKIEGIDSREQAKKFLKKEVWVTENDLKKFAARSAPISLLNYKIISESKSLGEISEVIEQPHQLLCKIEISQKEVLIPLNETTIKKIDHKKKEVIVELPEGLLEIYLD